MTIDDLNQASEAEFISLLAAIYEHSPWIAARAARSRPFAGVGELRQAMVNVLENATANEQMELIVGHPDLAGRLARAGRLAPSSVAEQASLGLERLSDDEFKIFDSLNSSYRERFGFPFVIAVKRHTRASVLAAFGARLQNDAEAERRAALTEINMIAEIRLSTLLVT